MHCLPSPKSMSFLCVASLENLEEQQAPPEVSWASGPSEAEENRLEYPLY